MITGDWIKEITIDQLPEPYKSIALELGMEDTIKLANLYQGTGFYLPKLDGAKIEDDHFRALVDESISRVDDLATKTVTQIEQTTAKTLREAVKDGKADKKELEELGIAARDEIIDSLSEEYKKALMFAVGSVEDYVTKAVETKVYELKNGIFTVASLETA